MKKINDFENVSASGEFDSLVPGAYVCRIVNVEDVADKEYLKIAVEIHEGEFKDYFKNLIEAFKRDKYPGNAVMYRSYKDKAISFFKGFIKAVEESNPGFKWSWDESKLKGKLFAGVFAEEEFEMDGETKSTVKITDARSIQALRDGRIKIKEKVKQTKPAEPISENPFEDIASISNEDLPF